MKTVRLTNNTWQYDPDQQLGPDGGFGQVFAGLSNSGEEIAVKRLYLRVSATAYRELEMAENLMNRSFEHILPIYDAGQDADSDYYFVVMPRAEKSLREEIVSRGRFSDLETIKILRHIATGLREVSGISHRDLKPENILYHDGRWKIADFGIARFVEEVTSSRTLKDVLSPYYAAPEQWAGESPSTTTDIYALGCIAFELINGATPFQDSSLEKLREQHLRATPPEINTGLSGLASLIKHMLRKHPLTRPDAKRVLERLANCSSDLVSESIGFGSSALQKANVKVAHHEALLEVEKAKQASESKRRQELHANSTHILQEMVEGLKEKILRHAPNAKVLIPKADLD
jgi:serine/threonine protein kinase